MPVQAVEKQLILPKESVQAAQAAAETLAGGPEQAALFKARNPSFGQHRLNVGGMMHCILVRAGVSQELQWAGTLMGVAHDDGKEGLELNNVEVWGEERIRYIRRGHTSRGLDMTLRDWNNLPYPAEIGIARFSHHGILPYGYNQLPSPWAERWALVHGVMGCDRTDAWLSREYAQETGADLSPKEVIDSWVVNGRPHAIPEDIRIDGQEINLGAALLPLMDVRVFTVPEQRQGELVVMGSA